MPPGKSSAEIVWGILSPRAGGGLQDLGCFVHSGMVGCLIRDFYVAVRVLVKRKVIFYEGRERCFCQRIHDIVDFATSRNGYFAICQLVREQRTFFSITSKFNDPWGVNVPFMRAGLLGPMVYLRKRYRCAFCKEVLQRGPFSIFSTFLYFFFKCGDSFSFKDQFWVVITRINSVRVFKDWLVVNRSRRVIRRVT